MLKKVNKMQQRNERLVCDAGIAIGPILFIIAVLGILASAIAAGSGSFTSNTTSEGHRAKASALIDIGQTLKLGFDRIQGNGTELADIIIDPTLTTLPDHLFSPTGGGVSAPSITMAADTSTAEWLYPTIAITNLGTSAGARVAVLPVTKGVCDEVNVKGNALAAGTVDTGAALGDFHTVYTTVLSPGALWPSDLDGKPMGCVKNTTPASAGYYFYQVLGVQ